MPRGGLRIEINKSEVDRSIRQLRRRLLIVEADVDAVIAKYTKLIGEDAKAGAPVDSGDLQESIKWRLRRVAQERIGEVYTMTWYAPLVHYGTAHSAGRPFMDEAFEKHKAAFLADLKKVLPR